MKYRPFAVVPGDCVVRPTGEPAGSGSRATSGRPICMSHTIAPCPARGTRSTVVPAGSMDLVTVLLRVRDAVVSQTELSRAAQCLRDGGLVAFPTETVYGLGAHALDRA